MRPSRLTDADIQRYFASGEWPRDTMVEAYARHALDRPHEIACSDPARSFTWKALDGISSRLAGSLVRLGLDRDECVVVQMPSDCREFVVRAALKKAGLIGAFVAIQWREFELGYVYERLRPAAVLMQPGTDGQAGNRLIERTAPQSASIRQRIALDPTTNSSWHALDQLCGEPLTPAIERELRARRFGPDDVSLVTTSSGTSGVAKLCEWPEAAQLCVGWGLSDRLRLTADDRIGVFAPMSGAAGVLLWTTTSVVPAQHVFPLGYDVEGLLDLIQRQRITVVTTVPAILARLAQASLESYDLSSLRAIRVGTAAMNLDAARSIEARTRCRVVPAAGSMECPGFGHANVADPIHVRLDGSVGLPLPTCRIRIDDENGRTLGRDQVGQLKVSAAFASSGYWDDEESTSRAWADKSDGGWYSTGDLGSIDEEGRLRLVGRLKEVINRSGQKILPLELEHAIVRHPDILECAIVGVPDEEYGEVPWAFVQQKAGAHIDPAQIVAFIREQGMATYKIPARFIAVTEFPRLNENKVDKKKLLETARGGAALASPN